VVAVLKVEGYGKRTGYNFVFRGGNVGGEIPCESRQVDLFVYPSRKSYTQKFAWLKS